MSTILQTVALYVPGGRMARVWRHGMRGAQIGDGTLIRSATIFGTDRPRLISHGGRSFIGFRAAMIADRSSQLGVEIGDDACFGSGAIIMPNVIVRNGAAVMAGSVATKSVPDLTSVRGNPAELIAKCNVPIGLSTPYEEFTRGLRPIRTSQGEAG